MSERNVTADYICIVVSLFVCNLSHSSQTISWRQSVEEVSSNNSELRSARENLDSFHDAKKGSYSNFLPQVTGTLSYDYTKNPDTTVNQFFNNIGLDNVNPSKTYNAQITVSQNLFSGLRDKALVDQSAANVELAEANLNSTKAKVSYDLKTAYSKLIYAQKYSKLQQKIIGRRKENLDLVQLKYQNGRENRGSLLLSKANLYQAHFNLTQAEHNMQVAQSDLARTLGRDEDSDFVAQEDIPLDNPPAKASVKALAMQSPEHQEAMAKENFADAGITLARSGFFPTLGLTASEGRSDTSWFPHKNTWSFGAQMTIPLFNGGKDYFGTRSAVSNYTAATSSRLNIDRLLFTKLRQAFNSYVEAIEKFKVDKSYLEAASNRSEIARGKYNKGLMSFEDWDLIENDLIARQTTVLASQRDLYVTEAAWLQSQGKGNIP